MILAGKFAYASTFALSGNVRRCVAFSLSTYDTCRQADRANSDENLRELKLVRNLLIMAVCMMLAALLQDADARRAAEDDGAQQSFEWNLEAPGLRTTQSCMSLSQAIDSVRRRGNVERIVSAETKVSGGREVHHIKVLTKDGKVQTHKVQGC